MRPDIAVAGDMAISGDTAAALAVGAEEAIAEPLMTPFRPSGKKRPLPVVLPAVTMEMIWKHQGDVF